MTNTHETGITLIKRLEINQILNEPFVEHGGLDSDKFKAKNRKRTGRCLKKGLAR